jgi:hypothetical protein
MTVTENLYEPTSTTPKISQRLIMQEFTDSGDWVREILFAFADVLRPAACARG